MKNYRFFALIIGTEILNHRRVDKHFDFVSTTLLKKGQTLWGSLVIKDDPDLIVETIRLIAMQPDSILLSFGGIGSTPDDHTRKCASIALRDGTLQVHQEAMQIIKNALKDRISPHSLKMAELPAGADLIPNPINQMPAFSLDGRFFFMPGFPQMSHPMTNTIIDTLLPNTQIYYRYTLTATCRESFLIEIMEQMPNGVEFSSLPKQLEDGWQVAISVASHDEVLAQKAFELYINFLEKYNIFYIKDDV